MRGVRRWASAGGWAAAPADAVLTDVQQRTAEQLFRTLGELKGGAMKFGQALSVLEAALPDELVAPYRENLTRLQDDAPPMPTQTVRDQLTAHLGPDWADDLVWLDGGPTAAASIGQVHKGRWKDGRDVAVKVQYPGAGEALMSDLRQIARVARGVAPVFPGIDIKPLVAELQARAADELDYTLEAEAQRAFAEAFRDDPDYVVPDVVAVGGEALVTEWLESPYSLAHVIREGTQEERDHYGELLARFLFVGPSRTGMLHADPHPGNFRPVPGRRRRARPARRPRLRRGRPAARRALPEAMGRLIRLAARRRPRRRWWRGCARRASSRTRCRSTRSWSWTTCPPSSSRPGSSAFRFTREWMRTQFERINNPRDPAFTDGHQAQPAAVVPPHPPHLARRTRPAQPAGGGGPVPGDPDRAPARLRHRLTPGHVRRRPRRATMRPWTPPPPWPAGTPSSRAGTRPRCRDSSPRTRCSAARRCTRRRRAATPWSATSPRRSPCSGPDWSTTGSGSARTARCCSSAPRWAAWTCTASTSSPGTTAGLITDFTVMVRPAKALQAVIEHMGAELLRMLEASGH